MWKCKTCIHNSKLNNKNEICEDCCKDVFRRLNRENFAYQEMIEKPSSCKDCKYIWHSPNGNYVCTINIWNHDDRAILNKIIRKNYLVRNTPKWCQLK